MAYLSFNAYFNILNEPEIALGLLQAGRHRSDSKFPEYMWIVCQIKVDYRAIIKILKYSAQMFINDSISEQMHQMLN